MNDPSLTELLPRLFASMAVVIGLMAIAARVFKNRQFPGGAGLRLKTASPRARNPIEILARQGLGRHTSIVVVRAGNRALVLGITEQNISVLTQLDEDALAEPERLFGNQTAVARAEESGNSVQARGLPTLTNIDVHRTDIDIDAASAGTSSQSWTGLLTQVRERTVRR